MDPRSETRLLRLAVERGLLTQEQVESVTLPEPAGPRGASPFPTPDPAELGPRSAQLVALGHVDRVAIQALHDEVLSHETTLVEVPWPNGPDRSGSGSSRRSAPGSPFPGAHTPGPRFPASQWQIQPTGASILDGNDPASSDQGVASGIDWLKETEVPEPPRWGTNDLSFLQGWDRYEISTFLGAGGMGQVYKAYDPALKRHVALKFLRFNDHTQLERFLREARAQARIDHPNICKVYEAGQVEGRPYIAMQLIAGPTLGEAAEGLTIEQKVQVVQQVALAIHAAHRMGLIHRDLKPGNILIEKREDGRSEPFVVDFGLVHDQEALGVTRTGAVTGTPAYLSPEQAQCQPVDRRSDVYSLGAVLYELLTGEVPLRGTNLADSLHKVVAESPQPAARLNPRIPRDLETIVAKTLEKEPQRRYDSARAFADDLGRFLNGEPIQARPPSLAYRTTKWVRKNRPLAMVLAGSLAALVTLALLSLRAQWQQAERARLLQRFSAEVTKVETDLRMASLLPLHDMRPYREEIGRRMTHIESEMKRLGDLAAGPGHFALGRGYLALHRYDDALVQLELAWKLGYRSPEVAAGLGRALGVLYQQSLLAIEPEPQGPRRGNESNPAPVGEVALIDGTYREPALRYLEEGSRESELSREEAAYFQAMLAFYQRRYEEAGSKAQLASALAPWFYEARQLEAEIAIEQAEEKFLGGEYDQALDRLHQAGEVYTQLLEVARSDATLYAADCRRAVRGLAFGLELSRFSEDDAQAALARCNQAIEVDADLAEAYTQKASLLWRWGRFQAGRGTDPTQKLEAAIASAKAAISHNPADALAFRFRGSTELTLARWRANHGDDPHPLAAAALASLDQALAVSPRLGEAVAIRGNVHQFLAGWQSERGEDPRPELDLALAAFAEAAKLKPEDSALLSNTGIAFSTRATYEMSFGLDPRASLAAAAERFRQAVEINPKSPLYHNNLCNTFATEALYLLEDGADPSPALASAREECAQALRVAPDHANAFANLTLVHASRAVRALAVGEDPTPALRDGTAALAEYAARRGEDSYVYEQRAQLDLVACDWAVQQRRDPRREHERAAAHLRRGLEQSPQDADLWLAAAELALHRVRFLGVQDAASRELGRQGLAAVDRCLALNPRSARALAIKGELLLHAVQAAPNAAESRQRIRDGRQCLTDAFTTNGRLRRTFGASLAALERLGE